jgi:hypothetical protein
MTVTPDPEIFLFVSNRISRLHSELTPTLTTRILLLPRGPCL